MTPPGPPPERALAPVDRPAPARSPAAAPRIVLVTTAVVFGLLVLSGALSLWPALLAASAVALAVAASRWSAAPLAESAPSEREASSASPLDTLMSAVVAALPDPAVVLDADAMVVAANSGATALAPALRRGEPALLVLRLPAIVEAIRRAGASGEPQRADFSERIPIDRWYEAFVVPMQPTALGGRSLTLVTFRDLTPLRRVEQTRADFVANASHELRTPLAALAGFIDTLQGSARDDPKAREEFLDIMKEQARRMARLIDDLLSLSRIELNQHIPPHGTADLVGIVRQVTDSLQMLAREREVDVVLDTPEQLTVMGDHDELMRVFENLIENALKYGASGKKVEVKVEAVATGAGGPHEAQVIVRDFGPGIAPEHLPRLTERFYRVDVGHSRAEGGTGLGLALVKHIITRHRGRLNIESQVGAGATFSAHLPVHRLTSGNT
jgi:two-component system, OmpR family, phosphate regulon sensor histidine kinase PhoR